MVKEPPTAIKSLLDLTLNTLKTSKVKLGNCSTVLLKSCKPKKILDKPQLLWDLYNEQHEFFLKESTTIDGFYCTVFLYGWRAQVSSLAGFAD